MPEGAVYVGRPTRWGNPFVLNDWQAAFRAVSLGFRGDRSGIAQAAVALYRLWLTAEKRELTKRQTKAARDDFWQREVMTLRPPRPAPTVAEIQTALRGRVLVCWCRPDAPCHADILLEIANAEDSQRDAG